jgi:hypothetical protein
VVGKSQAEAEADIQAAGFTVGQVTEQCSDDVPAGNVISQNPTGGTEAEVGSAVDLVVASGPCPPDQVPVPDVVGETEEDAENFITQAGLVPDKSFEVTGDPKGRVVSQDPPANTLVDEGSTVSVVISLNNPPTADAGPDQADVSLGDIQLDGSGSSDLDADEISYEWNIIEKPDGSNASLDDPNAVNPILTIDKYGTYVVELVVFDGEDFSDPDEVMISTGLNLPPVADAGEDQTVMINDTVCLDGSGSFDPNGDVIDYEWSMISKPDSSAAMLDNPAAVDPCFVADKKGTYEVQLIVNDGELFSEPDTVIISVGNSKPVADAGNDQNVLVGEVVCLDGSGSQDIDEDPITYKWDIIHKPMGSIAELDDPTAVDPCFSADEPGEYVVQLIVNDGELNSDPDTVMITARIEGVLPCDLDGDGDADSNDRNIIIDALRARACQGDPDFVAEADFDQDGCITLNDYREWLDCFNELGVKPCDLDGNGVVDNLDRDVMLGAIGTCMGDDDFVAEADFDGDGCVTLNDYRSWFSCAKSVMENPSSS